MHQAKNSLSIVLPTHNEGACIANVYEELKSTLQKDFHDYEIIFVNDGSTDNSSQILDAIVQKDKRVKHIHIRDNVGQSKAIMEGIVVASHERVVMMDGDGQYNPKNIRELHESLEGSVRLVSGKRDNRKDSFLYRGSSFIGNSMIAWFFGMKKFDLGCGLKIGYKEDLMKLPHFKHVHRYFQIIYANSGLEIQQLEINHRPRLLGYSKYSILKVWNIIPRLFWIKINKPKLENKVS